MRPTPSRPVVFAGAFILYFILDFGIYVALGLLFVGSPKDAVDLRPGYPGASTRAYPRHLWHDWRAWLSQNAAGMRAQMPPTGFEPVRRP